MSGGEDHSGRRVAACHDSSIVQVYHARVQIISYVIRRAKRGFRPSLWRSRALYLHLISIQLLPNSGEQGACAVP